eukprot:6201747-Pleurochrysis_carterae.AAC.1
MYAAVCSCRYTWAEYSAAVELENETLSRYRSHRDSTLIAHTDEGMEVQTFAANNLYHESLKMHGEVVLQCTKRAVEQRAVADRLYELLNATSSQRG